MFKPLIPSPHLTPAMLGFSSLAPMSPSPDGPQASVMLSWALFLFNSLKLGQRSPCFQKFLPIGCWMLMTEQQPQGLSPKMWLLWHTTGPAESSKAPVDHRCSHTCTCVTQEQCPQPLYLVLSHSFPWENFKCWAISKFSHLQIRIAQKTHPYGAHNISVFLKEEHHPANSPVW